MANVSHITKNSDIAENKKSYNMEEKSMGNCLYFTAAEVQEMLGVSRGHAYKVVKNLNEELKEKGYIVIAGRIPRKYFAQKYYGMDAE